MVNQILYDFLFGCKILPEELKNESERQRLVDFLESQIERIPYGHKILLSARGHTPERIYFVENGCARAYIYDDVNEKEKTDFIWLKTSLMADATSFLLQTKSSYYIEVVTPGTVLVSLTYAQVDLLLQSFPYAKVFVDYLLESNKVHSSKYFLDHYPNASDRLDALQAAMPPVKGYVTNEMMASFLGITTQHLNRLLRGG
ncbi:Crp/Fnr family transcriptional regulator [Pedobacter metabolipauper]|nr:Crp/Fnr family transcriptional regulator [Pedobacter metabolipauper]